MDSLFLVFVLFLGVLAIIDLVVGVSNDAVNFLNSAIGAKVASFKVVLFVSAIGVFLGASLSNGMMDIARNGIYHPEYFTFQEVLIICLTAMISDVILLNIFNSLGLPTSTTVSMVFNLLGAAFCISMLKINAGAIDPNTGETLIITDLINTGKALQVIIAIFMSVAIAFVFGFISQFIARVVFTFNYVKQLKYFSGIFGGIALTAILYFMVFKGLKEAAFMHGETKQWLNDNISTLLGVSFVLSALIMQGLNTMKVNIFRIIILAGTLALSLAFAGNDLVNFIGIPLAGLSAYQDYALNGQGMYDSYLMAANNASANTPLYFLIGSGVVMVLALVFSKSSQKVIQTSVNLSRQDDVEESYGTSKVSRGLVRVAMSISKGIHSILPESFRLWLSGRFDKNEIILAPGAAFDLVRASVNLVLAALLISVGTSLKLPLSTTYVTFMVAMGTALADGAWGRESSVGRLTGVIGVIGGWFVTAGASFIISAVVATSMYFGGFIAMGVFIAIAIALLFSSSLFKKKNKEDADTLFIDIMSCEDEEQAWDLISKHVRTNQIIHLDHIAQDYLALTDSFLNEDLRSISKLRTDVEEHKRLFKTTRRKETIGLRRLKNDAVLERNMWFHMGANACLQLSYAIERSTEVCHEHISNNYNPLPSEYQEELIQTRETVLAYLQSVKEVIFSQKVDEVKNIKEEGTELRKRIRKLRKQHMKRTHLGQKELFRVSIVYLNMLQETNEIINNLRHLVDYTLNMLKDPEDLQAEED